MQYLSQRLASTPSPTRRGGADAGAGSPPQRERILDAAERLIAARGVAGTSIEAIVKEAGVSSVTFYDFFEGKQECFVAAFDRAVEAAARELARAAAGDPAAGGLSWPERVATGLRALTRLIPARPEGARLCLVEAQTGGSELGDRFEAALDRVAATLREGRALETAPSDLPPSPSTRPESSGSLLRPGQHGGIRRIGQPRRLRVGRPGRQRRPLSLQGRHRREPGKRSGHLLRLGAGLQP